MEYLNTIPAHPTQEVLLPREELERPHAVKHLRHQLDPLVFGRHHLGAHRADLVRDVLVEGNHDDCDGHADEARQADLAVQEEHGDGHLRWEASSIRLASYR